MEKPFTGLTALVKINGTTIGYINNVELNLEKDIAEVLQFGAQYREKLPTIKNWTASSEGTAAFEAGGSQQKLYQAYESGELVTLTIKLDEGVYFEGQALIASLSVSGAPDQAMSISASFEGSGGLDFVLPETITVKISSSVGGTTSPAGIIRVAKGNTLTVACTPSAGKVANKWYLNGDTTGTAITANTFTTSALSADATIYVDFVDAE